MIDRIRPHWWVIGSLAAFALGIVGLYVGWSQVAPVAILVGEICAILAAIMITTPSMSESLAAQRTAGQPDNGGAPTTRDDASQSEDSPPD